MKVSLLWNQRRPSREISRNSVSEAFSMAVQADPDSANETCLKKIGAVHAASSTSGRADLSGRGIQST